jgi:hypothetical protein
VRFLRVFGGSNALFLCVLCGKTILFFVSFVSWWFNSLFCVLLRHFAAISTQPAPRCCKFFPQFAALQQFFLLCGSSSNKKFILPPPQQAILERIANR